MSDRGPSPHRTQSARDQILGRVRDALAGRAEVEHPGSFGEWRPDAADMPASAGGDGHGRERALDEFEFLFCSVGGEVARVAGSSEARQWIEAFAPSFGTLTVGEGVMDEYVPQGPARTSPADAELGLSRAEGAVAETGSLILFSDDGRGSQLLAPVHVVLLDASQVFATLREALMSMRGTLPSAVGLHSGPSKSADIGQVMVRGVHGPGRVIALVLTNA